MHTHIYTSQRVKDNEEEFKKVYKKNKHYVEGFFIW